MNLFRTLFFTLFALASAHAFAAVVYVTDGGGLLTGATGVVVDGVTYDVAFQDGTCVGLFPACDASTVFEFNTEAAALLASQALSNQVFTTTTTEGAIFTGTPGLTAGVRRGNRRLLLLYRILLNGDYSQRLHVHQQRRGRLHTGQFSLQYRVEHRAGRRELPGVRGLVHRGIQRPCTCDALPSFRRVRRSFRFGRAPGPKDHLSVVVSMALPCPTEPASNV